MWRSDARRGRILPDSAITYLEGLETEIGRPILLVQTGGGYGGDLDYLRNRAWSTIAARTNDENVPEDEEERDQVLTLYSGGQLSTPSYRGQDYLPDSLTDGAQVYMPTNEYMGLHETAIDVEAYEIDGLRIGSIDVNRVAIGINFANYLIGEAEHINWDRLYGDAIRAAIDPDFIATAAERRAEREQRSFAQFLSGARNSQLDQVRQNLAHYEAAVTNNTTAITAALRELRAGRRQIELAEAAADGQQDRWSEMWGQLQTHPQLTSVRWNATNSLILTTDHIHMTHPETGDTRWLGRFEITINPQRGSVLINNLDNPKGGRSHPHIPGQSPCWGNLHGTISNLVSENELYALTDILLMFLSTFNLSDDWGLYGAYWFDIEDETPEGIERPGAVLAAA